MKIIKIDDKSANIYIGQLVYGISGYPFGTLEIVNELPDGSQEFWVRNHYGLIPLYEFFVN